MLNQVLLKGSNKYCIYMFICIIHSYSDTHINIKYIKNKVPSIRSWCRDVIKHFTSCKTNRYKEYYIKHTWKQLTWYVQSSGCPKTKHPFIYMVYTYILIFTQYIMTIYISKLFNRQKKTTKTQQGSSTQVQDKQRLCYFCPHYFRCWERYASGLFWGAVPPHPSRHCEQQSWS